MIGLFRFDINVFLNDLKNKINSEIENTNNDNILFTEESELIDYYFDLYSINEIEIYKDSIEKNIKEIKKEIDPAFNTSYNRDKISVDAHQISYLIPFIGRSDLLYYRPSTYVMSSFEVDNIIIPNNSNNPYYLVISLTFTNNTLSSKVNKEEYIEKAFAEKLRYYWSMIDYLNKDIKLFNNNLRGYISNYLQERKSRAEFNIDLHKTLNIPLKQDPNTPSPKPIPIRKVKQKPQMPKMKASPINYCLDDINYENIRRIIKMCGSSMEKTPNTFNKLEEEEIRDFLIATLNTHYEGLANAETFRVNGKTDISISFDNHAAYIAECKVWHGESQFYEAIEQLFGYIIWRDFKTSLIFFNKNNKDFSGLTNTIQAIIGKDSNFISKTRRDKNEWQCKYKRKDKEDIISLHIVVFNFNN